MQPHIKQYAVGIQGFKPFYKTVYLKPALALARTLRKMGYIRTYLRTVKVPVNRTRQGYLTS